jgi:hypothetical protein
MKYQEAEEKVVIVASMGEAAYNKQQQDLADMNAAMSEVRAAMTTGTVGSKAEFMQKVQSEAQAVMVKRKFKEVKSRQEMDDLFVSMPPDERAKIYRAEALARMSGVGRGGGGGSHTHSHNGQPCHGHGQPQPPPAHTHSHNGQPCGGHGHSHGDEDEEDDLEEGEYEDDEYEDDHGHSHDHGHDHGHSHDHHGHSHDHHGHSH